MADAWTEPTPTVADPVRAGGAQLSPIRALTYIIQYGAYLILGVYLLTVIAALVLVWRHGRRPIPLLILSLGIAVLLYVLRDTFIPLPGGPFRFIALAAAGSTILGIIVALIPAMYRRLAASALLGAIVREQFRDRPGASSA